MTALRIASYNIRKALGTDRKRDPQRVLRVIKDLQADVVLLQEADYRLGPRPPVLPRDMIQEVTGLTAVEFDHGRSSFGWLGNALLIRPEVELIEANFADLPGLEPRGYIEAQLAHHGQQFRVVGVHLGLLRTSRRTQLTALNQRLHLPQPANLNLPTFIAGDFNERSLTVGLGRLARHFTIHSAGPTYHSRFPVFSLDRIAATHDVKPKLLKAHRSREAALASDHLPLIGEFTLSR